MFHRGSDSVWMAENLGTRDYLPGGYGYGPPIAEIRGALSPLIGQIRKYDALRLTLEREGGRVSDLGSIAGVLNTPLTIQSRFGAKEVQLTEQVELREAIRGVDFDVHLDVRQLPTHLPVYYLCRVRRDYWGEYSLIVEDLYMSPGYPMTDQRFIKLMSAGHEVYFLRLSPFREGVAGMAKVEDETAAGTVDTILYGLGRHVFQAAWHDDQRMGVLAGTHLGLPRFRQAIDLLYLCLSGELCELRGAVNDRMLRFFEEVYPHPPIRALLEMLTRLDGGMINDLPQRSRGLYKRLQKSFKGFLAAEVTWGPRRLRMPLWKLLCGNFSRLPLVATTLGENRQLASASAALEKAAEEVIGELLAESEAGKGRADGRWEISEGPDRSRRERFLDNTPQAPALPREKGFWSEWFGPSG